MNINISLIFLIIILILSFINENFVNNNSNWERYRLGDIIKYWTNPKYDKFEYEYIKSIHKKYPNSLGDKYLKKNPKYKKNLDLFFKIVDKEIKKQNIPKLDCILHLRIGDVINQNLENYITKPDKLKNNLIKLKKTYGKNLRVNIIYGSHYNMKGESLKKNIDYLNKIKNIFKDLDIQYEINTSKNPDTDFLLMCNSNIFIQSGGGYSGLIADFVKSRGKKVISNNT